MQPVKQPNNENEPQGTRPEETDAQDGLEKIRIKGGRPLNGTIPISGAKNSVLKLMCASLLTHEALILHNVPTGLRDIKSLTAVLEYLGVKISIQDGKAVLQLQADTIERTVAPYDLVRKMRASVLVLAPLIARCGSARVSLPGGCAIGGRPVDLHLMALEAMGADIKIEEGYIVAEAPEGLKGAEITLPFPSVGATECALMAAVLAKGTTTLRGVAQEPEIGDLAHCLNKMGARITGIDTETLSIEGVETLNGCEHHVIPDRIETGTYMIAAALTGGQLRLANARLDTLQALVDVLEESGVTILQDGADIIVKRNGALKPSSVTTAPYPGFATDLQAQMMVFQALTPGTSHMKETIFENRFMHVPELARMGADIQVQGNEATITGVNSLNGAPVMATDLRASVAMVLAALMAEGETTISRIYHLDRGYDNLVAKLSACGADINRTR